MSLDHEIATRELVMEVSSQNGFVVLTAADGYEALRILAARQMCCSPIS
jgi:DNA-binding response OmpR family regulator